MPLTLWKDEATWELPARVKSESMARNILEKGSKGRIAYQD